ncbi:uncharacterized protein [Dysidea avara]|uniref:uncharacterized protein n=1 Tax=Dysidea avara TaxID=196820 RepID=UPI00331E8FC7
MTSPIVVMLIVGVWFTLQLCCNAHEADNKSIPCDEMTNCSEYTCLREYAELESYILNNTVVLSEIVKAFFKTGEAPSDFVKIKYEFELYDNSTNNCTKHRDLYFWSSSPLYLLGPRSLFFTTIFAVDVAEERLHLPLPCLCKQGHGALLSRLTYLVKTYAVQDQSQSIRYISQFFVHAKNKRSDDHEASDKYHIVVSVMITAIIFPLSLLLTFTAMDRFLIHPKLYSFLKQTDNATNRNNTAEQPENNNEQHTTESSLLIELLYNKDLKIAHTLALLSLSIVLHLFLLTIYCLSIWKFFEYCEELFCHDYDFDDDDDSDCVTGDHLIPIFQVIVSAIIIILVYLTKIFLFCKTVVSCWTTETKENRLARWTVLCYKRVTSSNNCLVKWICKTENNQKDHLVTFTLSSLGANITIAGIYFAPYILLAFLTAPQEAIFFYFIVTVFLAVSYIFFLALFALCYTGEEFRRQLIIIIGATISTAYFFVAFILVLTLGNINNFQDAQTVLFTLLLALLSIFVFKPIYKGIQTKIEEKEKRIRHHE